MNSPFQKLFRKFSGLNLIKFAILGCLICCANANSNKSAEFSANPIVNGDHTFPPQNLLRINEFETYCKLIDPKEEVEVFVLEWPSDDQLCDSYDGSAGNLTYTVYRLKKFKTVVKVSESGAFCQGDSEYSYDYLFDSNGLAVYSEEGGNIYLPTILRFYEKGIPKVEVEYNPEEDLQKTWQSKLLNSTEIVNSKPFDQKIETYRQTMESRIESLKSLNFDESEPAKKMEAENLISIMEESMSLEVNYKDGFEFRKPQPIELGKSGEKALIKALDVRVRTAPNQNSEVIAKVSYYNWPVEVLDIQGNEMIDPFGRHPWYKIRFQELTTQESMEGWVFGAFILEGIYPVE